MPYLKPVYGFDPESLPDTEGTEDFDPEALFAKRLKVKSYLRGGKWVRSYDREGNPAKALLTGAKFETTPVDEPPEMKRLRGMKDMGARRKAFEAMSPRDRDALADPTHSIPQHLGELLPTRAGTYSDNGHSTIAARLDELGDTLITPEAIADIRKMAEDLSDDLDEVSDDAAAKRAVLLDVVDLTFAQEHEAQGRTLGDHGIRHLKGDADMAIQALDGSPWGADPKARAMLRIAAAFHDAGYLTPPSKAFLDMGHPKWSAEFYDSHEKDNVARLLGTGEAEWLSHIIATHDAAYMNWDDPHEALASAFRLGDNLALFQKQKLPALAYYVPKNTGVLVELGRKISEAEEKAGQKAGDPDSPVKAGLQRTIDSLVRNARIEMRRNLHAQPGLTPEQVSQMDRAVDEIGPVSPKFMVGMVGGEIGSIDWADGHPVVHLNRGKANLALDRVLDLGQRQFAKAAKTWKLDPKKFLRTHRASVKQPPDTGPVRLELVLDQVHKRLLRLGHFLGLRSGA